MHTKINDKIFDTFPVLESQRLIFRAFEHRDRNDLFQLKTDEKVMEFMDGVKHQSIQDTENLIEKCTSDFEEKNGINWGIIEKKSNLFIGYFSYWRLDKSNCRGEIGYSLKPDFWRQGYMYESAKKIIEFGFKDLHLHTIEGNVNPNNKASKRLLLKLGFQQEAYFRENYLFDGRFVDSVIYSLLEKDWTV